MLKKSGFKVNFFDIFFIIFILSVLFPVLYVVSISFSNSSGMYTSSLFSVSFTVDNYINLFVETNYLDWLKNSIIVSGITMVVSVFLISYSAYIFSRIKFYGGRGILKGLMLLQIFPVTMSMVSVYKIMQMMGLVDSLTGLVILYTGMTIPFSIWLVKGYIDSIPISIEESAMIDGAGRIKVFFTIILPLIKPILAVVAINNFIVSYSEYVLGSVLMTNQESYTIAIGLRTFLEGNFGTNWPIFAAGAIISSIPALVLFFMIQDFFVSGLTTGAID